MVSQSARSHLLCENSSKAGSQTSPLNRFSTSNSKSNLTKLRFGLNIRLFIVDQQLILASRCEIGHKR